MKRVKKLELRKYQHEDLDRLRDSDVNLYAADIGTGKSVVALKLFEQLKKDGFVTKCLIVATPRIIEHTWPEEIEKWVPHMTYATLHGGPVKRAKAMESDVDIYLVTYDILKKIMGELYDDITMIICDESHRLKNGQTARFKAIKKNIGGFPYRLFMTGSPMPNSLEDLWGQARLLDDGATLGKFITPFRRRWFVPDHTGFKWEPRPDAEAEIFEAMSWMMTRREATKEAGIPEVVTNDIMVTLPPDVLRTYKELELLFITQLKSGKIIAANAGAASMKIRQICQGFLYGEGDDHGKRVVHVLHQAKIDALEELITSLQGKPLLLAYVFKQDSDLFKESFGTPSFTGVTGNRARDLKARWDNRELETLAIHPASAGEGLNLQRGGNHLCFFGLQWNPALYHQTIGRLARSGQPLPVFVHRILVQDSIEARIAKNIVVKTGNQQRLFDAIAKDY